MAKQVQWGIYAWVHVHTRRMYVGQVGPTTGFDHRRRKHLRDLGNGHHHSDHFQNAWNLYGESEFMWVVLEDHTGMHDDPDVLTAREQWWMDNTDSALNVARVAGSVRGVTRSPETRQKISESKMGHPVSPETRAKVGDAARGRMASAETRAKLSEAARGREPWMKGRHHTPETRAQVSETLRGRAQTPEHVAKRAAALRGKPSGMLGKHHSAETRAKMRASHLARRTTA